MSSVGSPWRTRRASFPHSLLFSLILLAAPLRADTFVLEGMGLPHWGDPAVWRQNGTTFPAARTPGSAVGVTDTVTVNPPQGYTLMVDVPPVEAVILTAGCAMGLCEVIVPSTLPLTGPSVFNGVRVDLTGTILVTGSLEIQGLVALTGGTIGGTGTMTVVAGGVLVIETGSLPTTIACALTNDGTITKWAGSLRTDVNGVFTNRGALILDPGAGLFAMNGGGTHSGAMTINADAFLRIEGGIHTFEATSAINGPGRLEITSGEMNVAARPSDLMIGTLWMPGTGVLSGAGNRTVAIFDVAGGTFRGTGVTTVTGPWNLTAAGPPVAVTNNHRLVVLGPVTYGRPSEPLVISEGAVLEIANSLAVTGFAPILSGGAVPGRIFIRPTASLMKSSGNDTVVEPALDNSGTVTVGAGVLSLSGGGIHAEPGLVDVPPGAMLRFTGGTHTFQQLTNLSAAGQVEVVGGGTVNLDAPGALTGFARLRILGGTLNSARSVNITEDFAFDGGTLSGVGTTTIFAIATRSFNSTNGYSRVVGGQRLIINGNTVYNPPAPPGLIVESGGVVEIVALFDIAGNHHIGTAVGSPGSIEIRAGGILRKSAGTGVSQIQPAVNNQSGGTVEVLTGTLALMGGGTSLGDFNVVAPATLEFNTAFGAHSLQAGSRVIGSGNVAFTANGGMNTVAGSYAITGSTLLVGGSVSFGADASTTNLTPDWASTVHVASGKTLTVSGLLMFYGGKLTGPGSTVVTGTVTFVDNYACHVDGHTLVLRSNTSYGMNSLLYVDNGGVVRNEAIFEITGDGSILSNRLGSPRIENVGTLRKIGGTSTTTIEPAVNNLASVSVSSGQLQFQGGGTSTGAFFAASPGQLYFFDVYGSTTLASGSSVSGTGDVYLDAPNPGPIAINGSFAVTGLTFIYQGNISFASPLPAGASTARLTIYFPTVDVATALTVSTAIEFNGGTLQGSGTTTLLPGGTVTFNPGSWVTLTGHTLALGGNTAFGDATLIMNSGAILQNAAMFDISGDGNIYGGSSETFTNLAAGTLRKSGGTGQTMVGAALNNDGNVVVTTGTLYLSGGGSSGGSFVATAPGVINFASSHTLGGTSSVGGTGDVYFSQMGATTVGGPYALTGSTFVIEWATATFAGAASTSGLTIDYGGIMEVPVSFSVAGPLMFVDGTLRGSGTTTLLASGSATFGGRARPAYLDGHTLVLNGNSTLAGITLNIDNGAIVRNTATFTVQDGVTVASNAGGPPRFENSGTLLNSGTTETPVHAPIVNTGTVTVPSGQLTFYGGGSGAGSFDASGTGVLGFAGGTYALTGPMTSSGGIAVAGATVNASGSFASTGLTSISGGALSLTMPSATMKDLNLSGGSLGGSAAIALAGVMNWTGGTLGGTTIVEIAPAPAALNVGGTATKYLAGATLRNGGSGSWSGTGAIQGSAGIIENLAGATFMASANAPFVFTGGTVPRFENRPGATFTRNGTGTTTTFLATEFYNGGIVQITEGVLSFDQAPFIQTAGSFVIAAGAVAASNHLVDFQGGLLSGAGAFNGNVLNSGGVLRPGSSPGALTIGGNYTQSPSGSLDVELAGLTAGTQFDQLNVTGTASLGGTLNIVLVPPYVPVDGNAFRILTFGALAPPPNDTFATTNGTDLGMGDVLQLTSGATYLDVVMNGNYAPSAVDDAVLAAEDTSAIFAVLANDTDADGDALSITAHTATVFGTLGCSATSCTYLPNPGYFGADSFTYTVSDGFHSATATVSITVTPVNDSPVAVDDSGTTPEDSAVTIPVASNDTDLDGDVLSASGAGAPSHGTVVCSGPGCTYTPAVNFNGIDSFTYTASDGTSTSLPATVTITVSAVQDNPTAVSDVATTTADIPITINVLANDSDVDGEALTVVAWTNGALGTVTCTPAGACTYTPRGTQGLDSFTYTVADSAGGKTVGTVTVDVTPCQNRAPSLVAPDPGARLTPSVRFEWTPSDRALRYRLMAFSPTSGMLELAVIPQPALPLPATIVSTVTVPLGTFSWWVVAEFPDGCPSLNAPERALTVIQACPSGIPDPLEPLEGASIDRTPVVFRWSAVPGALGYTLFVTINDSEKLQAATAPEAEGTPSAAMEIPAGATVSWYVEATLPEGCGTVRSRTVQVSASCFPPVLSLQGEVTTDKPYQVRATIVSVGVKYLFEESDTESFASVLAQYEGEVDPTGEFVFATVEHTNVMEPTAYFYRVRLDQQGCAFSDVGRIVVLPLPPSTSTEVQTVVQEGTEEEIRQELFIASPTPDRPTSYTYLTSSDREWMRVEPAGGMIGQSGVTLTIVSDPTFLQVGTNVGTVTVTFIELAGGKSALATTPVSTSKPVSVTLVTPVTNKGKEAPTADSLIIPAVAHSTGVNSEWQTDIRLLNLGSDRLEYALNLTVSGQDGTQSGKTAEIELAAGQNSALNDVVKQWYGLGSLPGEGATGVLEIRPLGPAGPGKGAAATPVTRSLVSLASSRTYNKTPQGTLGEYIPAIPYASFAGGTTPPEGEKSVLSLQQLAQSSAYRSNLGIVEGSGQPVEVEIRFYDAEGAKLLTVPLSLKAGEHRQLNQVLAANNLTNVPTARAEVEVVSGNGKIAAYASVVDNVTGDPLQVSAVDLAKIGARKYVMPGIAHFDTGQARWRTDVQLFNAGLASVNAQVAFYPVGASAPSKTATVDIGPGKIRTLTNIVSTLFGETNTGGAVQIATATNSELVVTGRTYDQRESGSYGQFMAAVTEDDAVGLGDRAVQVLQLEESSNIRSNLGIVEITGKEVRVELTAFPSESRVNPRAEFTLKPNEFRQMNAVLKSLNAGTTYNARIALRVIGGDGKVVAYGSAVDNLTQDPTYIPGQ